jgi:Tol biopolymer transport system component
MATVTRPPRPPSADELEALIKEARQRQRRRQRRIGAAVVLSALAAGTVVYLVLAGTGGKPRPTRATPAPTPPKAHRAPQIVFAADRTAVAYGEIYRVDPDGHRVNLSRSPAVDVAPAVSPDGKWLAFLSDRGGNAALYAVGIGGRPLLRLSPSLFPVHPGDGLDGRIAWSPDSRSMAVAATGDSSALYLAGLHHHGKMISRSFVEEGPVWSPDGRLLAYTARRTVLVFGVYGKSGASDRPVLDLNVVSRSGAPVWQARGGGGASLSWSKTGRLASVRRETIRVYDAEGRRLDSFRGRLFAWSPSDDRLASMWHGRLEVRRGGTGQPVESFRERAWNMRWSEADRIFLSHGSQWISVDPSTGARSPAPHPEAAISQDGSRIATSRQGASRSSLASPWLLTVSRSDGSRTRTLVRAPPCARDWGEPFAGIQFVPQSRALVYETYCAEPLSSLYAIDADGSHLRRLTQRISNEPGAVFSPDGHSIAFSETDAVPCKGCSAAIWLMDANGEHVRQLTHPRQTLAETDSGPSWSPDGKKILFSRSSPMSRTELYVVSITGGRARPIRIFGGGVWGPTKIAYLDDSGSLWTARPDASNRRRISAGPGLGGFAWSRSGRLAFLSHYGHVVDVAGGPTVRLRLKAAGVAWSPDGSRLLLSAARGAEPTELYMLDLKSHRLRQLTSGMGWISGMTWR